MASTEEASRTKFDIIQHETGDGTGYVIYIVDIWEGNKTDPVTDIYRYIGVWDPDTLEDADGNAVDPDFTKASAGGSRYRNSYGKRSSEGWIEPRRWEILEHIKKADRDAESYERQTNNLLYKQEGYYYGSQATTAKLYTAFTEAIERVATEPESEEAWAAIEAWREHAAMIHEK